MYLTTQKLMALKENSFLAAVPVADIADVMAAAYATFKVSELNVPSAPVDDLHAYYIGNIQQIAIESISEFNECFPVNTDKCKYLIHKLWCIKYNSIHWNETIIPNKSLCYFESIANVDLYLDPETLKFLNAYSYLITGITNALKFIDAEMEKERINNN